MSTESELAKVKSAILKATFDRQKGSASRAFWYGGRSKTARGASYVTGKAKPGAVASTALKAVVAPLNPIAAAAAGFLAGKLVDEALLPQVIEGAKQLSRWLSGLEQNVALTARLDNDFKKLKDDAIPLVDRNVAKFNDAIRAANKAVAGLDKSTTGEPDWDGIEAQAEATLRAVYEVGYYHAKLTGLVFTLTKTVKGLSDELKKIDDSVLAQIRWVEQLTGVAIGNCLALDAEHAAWAQGRDKKPFDSRGDPRRR